VPGGIDYDNTINFNVGGTIINNKPYMRGPSPSVDPRIIRVGAVGINIGDTTNPVEQKADYSNTGPGIAVYAPGTNIVGAISNVFNPYEGMHIYPYNSNFLCDKRSGTSMSAPQVSGIVCNLLQSRPWYDIGRIKKYLMDNATPNRLTQTGASGYSNFTDLQGGPNTYLYNPFQYTKPTVTTDLNAEIYGKL
jgi:subtilisin family serine protease